MLGIKFEMIQFLLLYIELEDVAEPINSLDAMKLQYFDSLPPPSLTPFNTFLSLAKAIFLFEKYSS